MCIFIYIQLVFLWTRSTLVVIARHAHSNHTAARTGAQSTCWKSQKTLPPPPIPLQLQCHEKSGSRGKAEMRITMRSGHMEWAVGLEAGSRKATRRSQGGLVGRRAWRPPSVRGGVDGRWRTAPTPRYISKGRIPTRSLRHSSCVFIEFNQ